jgi:FMN phosphatase YigB (HAD superfamily)
MSIRYILFDLDGTLLPMDQDVFVKSYLGRIARAMALHGYDPDKLVKAIWSGTDAMVRNDGSRLNEAVFWDTFAGFFGTPTPQELALFDAFYREGFPAVQESCGFTPRAKEVLDKVKALGMQAVLATNPIFPAAATHQRVQWAGLQTSDFLHITTYENASFCKPNPDYYREILHKLGLAPEECLMVGNDATEDMVAETLGMQVFLLTPCLINKHDLDLSRWPQGDFDALLDYLDKLNA